MEPLERHQDVLRGNSLSYLGGGEDPAAYDLKELAKSSVYKPLLQPDKDFRILHLHASEEFQDPLDCSLEYVTLGNHPHYQALSYTWGNFDENAELIISGTKHKTAKNLDDALRHLHRSEGSRALWVDAVCIDQSNLVERSHQVRLMKDIYSSCTADLVWLGKADKDKLRAIELTRALERCDIEAIRQQVRDIPYSDRARLDIAYEDAHQVLSRSDWAALQALYLTPRVWRRVWIMQEIACATNVILVVGSQTLEWDTIARFLDSDNYPDAITGLSTITTTSTGSKKLLPVSRSSNINAAWSVQ